MDKKENVRVADFEIREILIFKRSAKNTNLRKGMISRGVKSEILICENVSIW